MKLLRKLDAWLARLGCLLVGHRPASLVCSDCGRLNAAEYARRLRPLTLTIGSALLPAFQQMATAAKKFEESMEKLREVLA